MHNGIDLSPTDKVKYFQEPICSVGLGTIENGVHLLIECTWQCHCNPT